MLIRSGAPVSSSKNLGRGQKKTPPRGGGGPTMLISLTLIYRLAITASLKEIVIFYNPFTSDSCKSSLSSVDGCKVQLSDAALQWSAN